MQMKLISIIVVALNPGKRLKETLDSIKMQTFKDYEVIIKDGGSSDGALDELEAEGYFAEFPEVNIVRRLDGSIYDGMNQALEYVTGSYVEFLNCGDCYFDENVLANVAEFIDAAGKNPANGEGWVSAIFYGNQFNRLQESMVTSAPVINDFTCYRNVPCHQVCFYSAALFRDRAFNTVYTVRADYEHFLYSVYEKKAKTFAMPHVICFYEGGGYSETKENRKKSALQHKEITAHYLGRKAGYYRLIMVLTLAGLRTKMAESPAFSKFYNALKTLIYKIK